MPSEWVKIVIKKTFTVAPYFRIERHLSDRQTNNNVNNKNDQYTLVYKIMYNDV